MLIAEKIEISFFYTNSPRNICEIWIRDNFTLGNRFVVLVKHSVATLTFKISKTTINYVILL